MDSKHTHVSVASNVSVHVLAVHPQGPTSATTATWTVSTVVRSMRWVSTAPQHSNRSVVCPSCHGATALSLSNCPTASTRCGERTGRAHTHSHAVTEPGCHTVPLLRRIERQHQRHCATLRALAAESRTTAPSSQTSQPLTASRNQALRPPLPTTIDR